VHTVQDGIWHGEACVYCQNNFTKLYIKTVVCFSASPVLAPLTAHKPCRWCTQI